MNIRLLNILLWCYFNFKFALEAGHIHSFSIVGLNLVIYMDNIYTLNSLWYTYARLVFASAFLHSCTTS